MKISDAKVWLTKKVLRENELFQNLDEIVLDSLITHADAKLLAKDEVLYRRGEAANAGLQGTPPRKYHIRKSNSASSTGCVGQ